MEITPENTLPGWSISPASRELAQKLLQVVCEPANVGAEGVTTEDMLNAGCVFMGAILGMEAPPIKLLASASECYRHMLAVALETSRKLHPNV